MPNQSEDVESIFIGTRLVTGLRFYVDKCGFSWSLEVLIASAHTVANILADVYSYPEDDSVLDPLLAKHLAHFGIDFSSMQKVSNGWFC